MKLKKLSLAIELSDYCNLSCPTCQRHEDYIQTNGLKTLKLHKSVSKNNITIDQIKKWFPQNILERIISIRFCGATGEPSLCPDIIHITEYFSSYNKRIEFSTNGSYHDEDWWKSLAEVGKNNLKVIWNPDSIKSNNNLYRIGSNTDKVISNLKAFNLSGGISEYRLILFDHNKDEIRDHMNLALKTKCKDFRVVNSNGFEILDEYKVISKNKKIHTISHTNENIKWNDENNTNKINCRCLFTKTFEINAAGILHPCCYMSYPIREIYQSFHVNRELTEVNSNSKHQRCQYFLKQFVPVIENYGGIKTLCLDYNSLENIIDSHPLFHHAVENSWSEYGLCNQNCAVNRVNNKSFWETFEEHNLKKSNKIESEFNVLKSIL